MYLILTEIILLWPYAYRFVKSWIIYMVKYDLKKSHFWNFVY